MASRLTFPRQDHTICSQGIPSATCSTTCRTITREPLKTGWPWQTRGSATMNRPSSTALGGREACASQGIAAGRLAGFAGTGNA